MTQAAAERDGSIVTNDPEGLAYVQQAMGALGRRVTSFRSTSGGWSFTTEPIEAAPKGITLPKPSRGLEGAPLDRAVRRLVAHGRQVALELCIVRGETDGHEVYAELRRRNLVGEVEASGVLSRAWIGRVFQDNPLLVKSGEVKLKRDESRGVNATNVARWKLRKGLDTKSIPVRPDIPRHAVQESLL